MELLTKPNNCSICGRYEDVYLVYGCTWLCQRCRKSVGQEKNKVQPEKENISSDNDNISSLIKEKTGSHRSPEYRDCYYCSESFDFDSDYKKHVVNKHQGKLCYPDKAYIDKHGLNSQDRDWEK
jgi:hypothetical protein